MTLTEINDRLAQKLASPAFPGLAGLASLSDEEYRIIIEGVCIAAGGDVGRLIWKIGFFPAAAVVALSRAAMNAYDENFWANFCREIHLEVPVGRREELTNAFCRAARQCIPSYERANWEAWKNIGEFLAQAGLPLHHCEKFAHVLRLAVDESGLPEPGDLDGVSETVARMLDSSGLHGQKVIEKALRGPAGPLLVEAAVAAISEGDFERFNPQLAKALQKAFDSRPQQAAGITLRRPVLKLDRDFAGLELHCPFPPQQLIAGQGIVWVINGERHRALYGQSFVVAVNKPALYVVEIHGLNSGRPVKWTIDARPTSWSRGFAAFDAETGRAVRLESLPDGLLLPPGDFYLLHETRYACDDVEEQTEWGECGLSLTMVSLKPGAFLFFYDGDDEIHIHTAKMIWLETSGRSFTNSLESRKVHYLWNEWPRLWISEEADPSDWTVEIAGTNFTTQASVRQLGEVAGGLQTCALHSRNLLKNLQPGVHRILMTVRHRDRVRYKQSWLFWQGLLTENESGLVWAMAPTNLLDDKVFGFTKTLTGLDVVSSQERARQVVFQIDSEMVPLRWLREGVTLESYQAASGIKSNAQAHQLGSTFPADEYSHTHLRISIRPAARGSLQVNGFDFKKAISTNGFIQFDVSLASLAALYPEGGKIGILIDSKVANIVAHFSQPLVATIAALKSENDYKILRCLVRQPAMGFRVRVRDLISGRVIVTDPGVISDQGEAFIQLDNLPRVKCANTGYKTQHGHSGFGIAIGVGETKWPVGAWWMEVELQSRPESTWETLRDTKGGRLPLLFVQNPETRDTDYRTHALWWGLAYRGGGGLIPSQLPPAEGNETHLVNLLREVGSILKDRISEHVWKKQFSPFRLLRIELSKQVNWLIDSGNTEATIGMILELNAEESTATPRSAIFSAPGLLAISPSHAAEMAEGDMLRTSLLWCGRLSAGNSIAESFHRLEFAPAPSLGEICPCQSPILRFFTNGNRLRSNGTLPSGEEFHGFDIWRFFTHLGGSRLDSDVIPSGVPALSQEHFSFAIRQLQDRRNVAEACSSLANVNTIFSKANLIAREIENRAPLMRNLMPQVTWGHPWPEITIENDNLIEMAVQFSSVYALAARLGGDGQISFRDLNNWLRSQSWLGENQSQAVNQATITLVCQAPELFGFFLMFWQLILQTHPHD